LKIGPVIQEVCKRLAGSEKPLATKKEDSKEDSKEDPKDEKKEEDEGDNAPDMRNVLGFLNQSEWIANMNIGNIM
jgi:hypothetical protein